MNKGSRIIKVFLSILGLFIVVFACTHYVSKKENPLARVYDNYLYKSEVKDLVNKEIDPKDSAIIVQNYIDMWIRNQLMLKKAEQNLSDNQKDVERQLEDYRAKLLIYKYKQQWISENLDTVVRFTEIENYYNSYSSNFKLKENILKALYIKIPKDSPDINKVNRWIASDNKKDKDLLQSYCYKFASTYDHFDSSWVPFRQLLNRTPINVENEKQLLQQRKFIEGADEDYSYYIKINDYQLRSNIAPLPYVHNDIRHIILNKRKIRLVEELENNIYSDALNYGSFKIYNKNVKQDSLANPE